MAAQSSDKKEILNFVKENHNFQTGLRTIRNIKSFAVGDVVLREKPLCSAEVSTDMAKFAVVMDLRGKQRDEFMSIFSDMELKHCGVHPDSLDEDRKTELEVLARRYKEKEQLEVEPQMSLVASVICRWDLVSQSTMIHMYRKISRIFHSCDACVSYEYDADCEMGVVVARHDLPPLATLGMWIPQDVHLYWKGADVRSAALIDAQIYRKECACVRCCGPDTCRAIKCPDTKCKSGEIVRWGKDQMWRCSQCKFESSDRAGEGIFAVEQTLRDDLGDLSKISTHEFKDWLAHVETRLGLRHWLAALIWREGYVRQVAEAGELSFQSCWCSICFLEWIMSRNLPRPPQALVKEMATMALRTLDFLQARAYGVRDLRVIFLRIVEVLRKLFEDVSPDMLPRFRLFAGQAVNMRRVCAFCREPLKESRSAAQEVSISEDDENDGPVRCGICQDLEYCDVSCQMADIQRHRPYCVPAGKNFHSKEVRNVMIAVEV
mmetsp:Transcript_117214/g.215644  ORF Transcript_117214/g.215644 Transcript_117214/m.215644 type:complete len:491 (+) Transcript_117214:40-1512(+)